MDDAIVMKQDIKLYGGFGGLDVGETVRSQRAPSAAVNPTLISGNNTSYHVITGASDTRLGGFTILDGHAAGTDTDSVGGGLRVDTGPMAVIITQNTSTGAAIDLYECTLTMNNCTIYDAQAPYLDESSVSAIITNSIIWTPAADAIQYAGVSPDITYSIVKGGASGTGVASADPLFISVPDDLQLQPTSPAIDAGNGDMATGADVLNVLRYDASVSDTGVGTPTYTDLGAYEYWP